MRLHNPSPLSVKPKLNPNPNPNIFQTTTTNIPGTIQKAAIMQNNTDPFEEDSPESVNDNEYSWTLESDTTAVKQTDRPVFVFRETVIPQTIRPFFSIEDLGSGQKRRIKLWYNDTPFEAFIEKTNHLTPMTRMIWKPDFAEVLKAEYPQWSEYFKKIRKEAADTPSIRFVQRRELNQYDIEFDGTPSISMAAAASEFHVPLKPGDVIDNDTLAKIFRCGPQGIMRRSPRTNSLVLIADHTSALFEDKWVNNFFHYTGLGLPADQSLANRENKILAESKTSGVSLHLFEVHEKGSYVYDGEAELADPPFISRQADSEKNIRDVYIFSLTLKGHKRPPVLKKEVPSIREEHVERKVPMVAPGLQAHNARTYDGKREEIGSEYERDHKGSMTEPSSSAHDLENLIRYDFRDKKILEEARTRRAFQNENQSSAEFMDPLATIGDAVLDLVAVCLHYERGIQTKDELTKQKISEVKRERTRAFAEKNKLHEYILWGKGESLQENWRSDKALDAVTEALIGAVFLDAQRNGKNGLTVVKDMLERMDFFLQ